MPAGQGQARRSLKLVPSARLQRYLGRELIADPSLAVIEFVKNSYDAGASHVVLDFKLGSPVRQLVISDDGTGMNLDEFEDNWMRPGFSAKSPEAREIPNKGTNSSAAWKRRRRRKPLGEKGLGRLASGRLGDMLEVYTRRSTREPWLHVIFDWTSFGDMNKAMADIPVPFDEEAPPEAVFSSGTVIVISHLSLKWEGRVPGRPIPGRSRSRLGRLKQDLQWLLSPLEIEESDFRVELISDRFDETADLGVVTPKSLESNSAYRCEFSLHLDPSGKVQVARELRRSPLIAKEVGEKRVERFQEVIDAEVARRQVRPASLLCGPFKGVFLYDPPPKGRRANAQLAVGHGVLLYRDSALVEPYGLDGNDWVGVEARKAQRQGHALIQPSTLSGQVRISRQANPELIDMANRQGLLDNDAAGEFIAHVQAEFREFEALLAPELERRHYRSKAEQAAENAERRVALARVRVRAIAHSLRSPLMGLTGEVMALKGLSRRADLPEDVKASIEEILAAMRLYVQRAETLLNRLADLKLPEFGTVSARDLVKHATAEASDELKTVDLSLDIRSDRELVLPMSLVVEAVAELLRNAAEATRPEGRPANVGIVVRDHMSKDVAIEIVDNGTGLDGVTVGTPLHDIKLASKGRPSGGLAVVADSISICRGEVELSENGPGGATFRIVLPGGLKGS